jgi:hypothetical protein
MYEESPTYAAATDQRTFASAVIQKGFGQSGTRRQLRYPRRKNPAVTTSRTYDGFLSRLAVVFDGHGRSSSGLIASVNSAKIIKSQPIHKWN